MSENRDDEAADAAACDADASVPGSCTLRQARAVPVVAGLLDAVDACRAVVATTLDAETQRALVVGLTAAAGLVDLTRLEAVAALVESGAWEADGSATAAGWIARWTPADRPVAARDVRTAKHLEHVPLVVEALAAGRITASAARMIADAAAVDPEAFGELEAAMIQVAALGELRFLRNVLREWTQAVKPPKPGDDGTYEQFLAKRSLHLSTSLDGVVYLKGQLDPITGAELTAWINARVDKARRNRADGRKIAEEAARAQGLDFTPDPEPTPAQARLDALMDLCRAGADTLARPEADDDLRTPKLATAVTLVLRAHDLHLPQPGDPDRDPADPGPWDRDAENLIHATLGDHDLLLPRCEVETLLCDCRIRHATTTLDGVPLDVGREQRTATAAIRTALGIRDRTCRFPTCRMPPRACHAHHIRHWEREGPTALANMALLCHRHHRLIHAKNGWGIHIARDGNPTITHNGINQPRNPHAPRLDDLARGKPPDQLAA